jgi:Xaa-Pro aminopeptidase
MRYSPIDISFFSENRKNLAEKLKSGSLALLFANYRMTRNGDQFFPYRQQSDFFYLTGIEQEKSILLIAPDSPAKELKEVLFILKSNETIETWEGHKLSAEEALSLSGIKTIKYLEEFPIVLHSLMTTLEYVYFNSSELPKFLPEVKSQDEVNASQIKEKYPLHKYERLAPILQDLRLKKSEPEITLIKQAIAMTGDAFLEVLHQIAPGMKEFEIEAIITSVFIRNGANGHAYAPIVAAGKNACVLHYGSNTDICRSGDLLLMDFGAEYANYAADLSRTIPVNGKYLKRQRELYDTTLRIFKYAKNCIKPGTTINGFHSEVCKAWEEEHIRLGLYTSDDVKNHKGENPLWFNYFMHGTSHFLGLDVHDVGTKDTVLEPGMVLTCEPAIYIAREGTGIRIENNLLITKDGTVDLMEGIPLEAEEIESIMSKRG